MSVCKGALLTQREKKAGCGGTGKGGGGAEPVEELGIYCPGSPCHCGRAPNPYHGLYSFLPGLFFKQRLRSGDKWT